MSSSKWYRDPIDHVRDRPETYVGALESIEYSKLVPCMRDNKIELVEVNENVSPVLLKMVDEIMVNAIDNQQRGDTQKEIRLSIFEDGWIEVVNDGAPISTHKFEDTEYYTPEVYFSKLLSGTNFNDDEERHTGGRNGIGAKAAFIFSLEASIEIYNSEEKKQYKQEFSNNLKYVGTPTLKHYSKKKNMTKIRFKPDYKMLTMPSGTLSSGLIFLLGSRAIDACACTRPKISVFLNEIKIPIKNMQEYAKAISGGIQLLKDEDQNNNFEVCFGISETPFVAAFVNGVKTNGGSHVDFVVKTIISTIQDKVKKKIKRIDISITPKMIKERLFIIMNTLIINPRFNGQMKEMLDTPYKIEWHLTPSLKNNIEKMFIDPICDVFSVNQQKSIQKELKINKNLRIEKYQPALKLGKKGNLNTLLVTEGDSAKALAIAGMAEVGRDNYGVFPLRGKIINVLKNSVDKVHANKEMIALTQILGLKFGHVYTHEDISKLPYHNIAIFSDQDHDGSHIAGLFINWVHGYYKSLLEVHPTFIKRFATPLIKAWTPSETHSFFSNIEFKEWLSVCDKKISKIKYYKGLGTSTDIEAREYFKNFDNNTISVFWSGQDCTDSINLFFGGNNVEQRKIFLEHVYNPVSYVDYRNSQTSIKEYLENEMAHFSNENNIRSIPSAIDSFKPVQRKIVFSVLNGSTAESKVSSLAAKVAQETSYHHADDSMKETIVNMAQRHVGTNNITLLEPIGQFGSRAARGNHAAFRYINTKMCPIMRAIFKTDDDNILNYMEEEGQSIEPEYFIPIVPFVLVNGADGIGTGWSTDIPNFNIKDIISNVRKLLKEEDMDVMTPYYEGFKGKIELFDEYFISTGILEITRNEGIVKEIHIKELPIGEYIDSFEKFLYDKFHSSVQHGFIHKIENYSGNNTPDIIIHCNIQLSDEEIYTKLNMNKKSSLRNMVLHDKNGKLCKFKDANSILIEHSLVRFDFYEKRIEWKKENISKLLKEKSEQKRFIENVINESIDIKQKTEIVEEKLVELDFVQIQDKFSYLLGMKIQSLNEDKIEDLDKQIEKLRSELHDISNTTVIDLWNTDLDILEQEVDKYLNSLKENNRNFEKKRKQPGSVQATKKNKK